MIESPAQLVRTAGDHQLVQRLEDNVCQVVRGKREVVRLAIISLLARGHILIEDVPGVGKTTLAQSLARSLGLSFQRIQFTSDLLPSDIIGITVYSREHEEFRFNEGPLFAQVVLADEINRATPKTQSALLEAMAEGTVTVDRDLYRLPEPFVVLATQNPLEFQGTFPLPESQLDRFLISIEIGYPSRQDEVELLMGGGVQRTLDTLDAVVTAGELIELQNQVELVHIERKLVEYMLEIAELTRRSPEFELGLSTRGLQGLFRAVQAAAFVSGRDYAIPDDVKLLAPSVLGHRVILKSHAGDQTKTRAQIASLLDQIPVPV